MSRIMRAIALAGVVCAAIATIPADRAVAGVIYHFDRTSGFCDWGDCSVRGKIEISKQAFQDKRIDDPSDVTAFSFAVSSEGEGGYQLDWNDLLTACGLFGTCIDISLDDGGTLLTGILRAHRLVEGDETDPPTSDEFSIYLQGLGGGWTAEVRSDAPPGSVVITGGWLRVAEPGSLSLLLAGIGAAGLLARHRRKA